MIINARSVINKLDLLAATALDLKPDVIGITESWANGNVLDSELQLQGYQCFRCDRPSDNRGGGVLLYVKSSLKPVEFHTLTQYGEHVWCQIEDLLIGVCYRSTNVAVVGNDNESKLHSVLHEVSNRFMLLMGDFNYPDIDWQSHSVSTSASSGTSEFYKVVEEQFLTQHVLSPTRGDAILDLVLSSEPDLVSNVSVIHNFGNSDHNMVTFTTHFQCQQFNNMKTLKDYKNGDYESINAVLASTNWNEFLDDDTAGCWSKFSNLLHQLEDKFIPVKRISGQNDNKKPMWMTHKAFKCVRKKRKVFRKYKDINHPAVKSACRVAKSELRKSRRNFEHRLGSNIKSDNKSFFAYVRSRTKSKVHTGPIYTTSGNMTATDSHMVEAFNEHFVSVFTAEDCSSFPPVVDRFVSSSHLCSDIIFTEEDVLNVLTKLRADKANGPDELSARFLIQIKEHGAYCASIVYHIQEKLGRRFCS